MADQTHGAELALSPLMANINDGIDEADHLQALLQALMKLCSTGGEPEAPLAYDDLHVLLEALEMKVDNIKSALSAGLWSAHHEPGGGNC